MVYGYKTNEEFINESDNLLEKLKKENLWNEKTLVIGLDKGVRPLAYTLRKLSKLEGQKIPEIKFFDFSTRERLHKESEIADELKKKFNPEKFEGYENVLILDDHIYTGLSLIESKRIFEKYFSGLKNKPKIKMAALGLHANGKEGLKKDEFIYSGTNTGFARYFDKGVEDKGGFGDYEDFKILKTPRALNKEAYKQFLEVRTNLSKDINSYLIKNHPEKIKVDSLEKKVLSGIFAFFIFAGLFLTSFNLTGNVVTNSYKDFNFYSISLFLIGILGFYINRKYKK